MLIIGSEGFIGSHCKNFFKKKDFEVHCADIILKTDSKYFFINPESANYNSIFSQHNFDVCINASGAANVQFSFNQPYTDFFLNTVNVYSILESIRVHNASCAFINLSSAAVYGNPEILPISEKTHVKPTSPYGLHKVYSEQICKEFHDFFGLRTLSLRIFSAYGPGLRKQLFWDLYQKSKHSNDSIIVYGTGKETRDFIYIDDLIHAIDCVVMKNSFSGDVINVASGTSTTIKEVATAFLKLYKPEISLHFSGEEKKGDPLYWNAEIATLKSYGFKNNYSMEKGITETVHWLVNNI